MRHSRGVLPMAATARLNGFTRIHVPASDAAEAALITYIEVYPVGSQPTSTGTGRGNSPSRLSRTPNLILAATLARSMVSAWSLVGRADQGIQGLPARIVVSKRPPQAEDPHIL